MKHCGMHRARWFTISTIIGATSMSQLRSNLVAFGTTESAGIDLTDDVLQAIDEVHNDLRNPALID